jgi:phosphoribosylamine-glycine ligase
MKVQIIGGGGREHALAWKCAAEAGVDEVLVAPGNAGTAAEPRVRNVAVGAENIDELLNLALAEQVDLTIVGPEGPLVAGVVDAFTAKGLKCFGPTRLGARLEGSKAFCKEFLRRHRIPTAGYRTFTRPHLMRPGCARAPCRLSSRPAAWPPARASSSSTVTMRRSMPRMRCSAASSARQAPKWS